VSLPPPGALPSSASVLHPELRVSMPPMGTNRASSAPLRSLPAHERGPSRAALGWAAGAAAMIVAAVVALLAWFGRPAPAILHVTTDPVDAVVTVDGAALPGTSSPFVATDMAPDVDHDIEVSRAGYHSWRTRLRLHAGRVLALPRIELQREEGTSTRSLDQPVLPAAVAPPVQQQVAPRVLPPAVRSKAAPTQSSPSHAKRASTHGRDHATPAAHETKSAPTPAVVSPRPAPVPAASSDDAKGTLRVNSRPWSRVYIDGRMVGNTPQMQLSLAAGWHTLTLVNPDFGLQKVVTIRIKPGELVTKIIDLSAK
jgi:serine/threonine-protein kinase